MFGRVQREVHATQEVRPDLEMDEWTILLKHRFKETELLK